MTPPSRPQPPYEDLERYVAGPDPVRRRPGPTGDSDRDAALLVAAAIVIATLIVIAAASRPAHDPTVAAPTHDVRPTGGAADPSSSVSDASSRGLTGTPRSGVVGVPPRPMPVGSSIGTALVSGTATWCAPTPRYCQSWGGNAHKAAMASFRWGDRPYQVQVCRGSRCTVVTVVSYCACGRTLIDLSPAAFRELAPLSHGRIVVTVESIGSFRLPETDTEGDL